MVFHTQSENWDWSGPRSLGSQPAGDLVIKRYILGWQFYSTCALHTVLFLHFYSRLKLRFPNFFIKQMSTNVCINLALAVIAFYQARGYLPSCIASMPFGQYKIILLGDRGTCV